MKFSNKIIDLATGLLKNIRFDINKDSFTKTIVLLTFRRIPYYTVVRFETFFNRKMEKITQMVCRHPSTYEDHYWSGGRLKCIVCRKTLKTLWLPTCEFRQDKTL